MSAEFPSASCMFLRALLLKCPFCGSRRTFIRRWLGRYPRCRSCGIRWQREHGSEIGAIGLNTILTFVSIGIGMVVAFVATAPDFPVRSLMVGFMSAAVVLPVLFYPFTNTLWLAFELQVHKPDEQELAEARSAVS